ncbi:MAG TPA: hypothetical protein VFY99_00150 [Solirubrobacterales bacterium]
MLFDLSGKRKRVVQVVYAALAVLFAVSFVGFGIGSDAAGGLFDAFGLGSDDNSSGNPAFEDQIDEAEQKVAADPKDEQALSDLVQLHYQAGNDAVEVDEATGQISMTTESEQEYNEAASAWQDYLKVAKKPDGSTAAIANQAYGILLQFAEPTEVSTIAEDAVVPAEISAEDTPGVGPWATVAQYAYFAGDTKLGDEATQKALDEADSSQRKQLAKDLAAAEKSAVKLAEEIKKQAEKGGGEEAFTNPLEQGIGGGALPGGTGAGLPGSTTPAP